MENIYIKKISDNPDLKEDAADWFSSKWSIDKKLYIESLELSIKNKDKVPQWYLVVNENNKIIAGAGVIENDFHEREDLTPNICALYVEKDYRGRKISKDLLEYIRKDLYNMSYKEVYLITDHIGFYEKYDWEFLDMVEELDGQKARMYVSTTL